MGCDIHMYLEFVEREDYVSSIAKFNLSRNYTLFSLMAGVRTYEGSRVIYQPRGLPDKIGWVAEYDNELYVVDRETDEEHSVSRENALKWIERGVSKWTNDQEKWVTHPDWHNHSWLNAEELDRVREVYESMEFPRSAWYQANEHIDPNRALIPEGATMTDVTITRTNDYRSSPYRVEVGPYEKAVFPNAYAALLASLKALGENGRIVFWFDN